MRTIAKILIICAASMLAATVHAADLDRFWQTREGRRLLSTEPWQPAHRNVRRSITPALPMKPWLSEKPAGLGAAPKERDAIATGEIAPQVQLSNDAIVTLRPTDPARPPTAPAAQVSSLWQAFLLLAGLAVGLLIACLGPLSRGVDRLFEPHEQEPTFTTEPLASADQPEMSAEGYRSEIESLRAIKDELEAQAEAARATIREALAQAHQQQKDDAA